jgi:hypothetical protein
VPFGMHIGVVVVEVVLVDVLVVLLVDVLVEVVLVEKHVGGPGSRQSSVPPHPPQQSQGWSACLVAASEPGVTQRVSALPRRHLPSSRGMWQILTVPGGQVIAIALVEGISAAMALPAKSLSALRRLMEPSAIARARSSKDRLVVCWLTCCPPSPKGGTLGGISPALS